MHTKEEKRLNRKIVASGFERCRNRLPHSLSVDWQQVPRSEVEPTFDAK